MTSPGLSRVTPTAPRAQPAASAVMRNALLVQERLGKGQGFTEVQPSIPFWAYGSAQLFPAGTQSVPGAQAEQRCVKAAQGSHQESWEGTWSF